MNEGRFETLSTIAPGRQLMKSSLKAYTFTELLLFVSVIAVLALMLLPALSGGHAAPQAKARTEMSALVQAIEAYNYQYGSLPLSSATELAAGSRDFTFGAAVQTPLGTMPVGTSVGGHVLPNSELIAILMNLTNFPGNPNRFTANTNYIRNLQQIRFLNAPLTTNTSSSGVGPDLVYRDPWGTPYFITMDLNKDGQCEDVLYRRRSVSQQNGIHGWLGLSNRMETNGNGNHYSFHGRVMVWSAGPDKMIDPDAPANQGKNKDNVISWQ